MAAKEEKRTEIIKAAIKVFSEAGFEGAKIEDIAKEAGIGKGTVYEYFESKNTLFQEMIHFSVELFREELTNVLKQGDNIWEKLQLLSQFYARFLKEHLDMFTSSMTGHTLSEDMRSQMLKQIAKISQVIEDMVRVGIQTSELRANIDAEIAAACILGGIKNYVIKKIFIDGCSPEEIDHDGVAKVILTGLIW